MINELRIGNLVQHNGNWSYRGHSAPQIIEWNQSDWYALGECRISMEDISPIILTEEWHNKFGSYKDGFKNFEYDICPFGKRSRVLIFSGDYLYIRDVSGNDRADDDLITIWNMGIKKQFYVHEFQNLYFLLTGKELVVK